MKWQPKKTSLDGLEPAQIRTLVKQKAARYLGLRPRLRSEIEDYLTKAFEITHREEFLQAISEVLDDFEKRKFFNDWEFIERFVEYQLTSKLRGPRWIQMKLQKRGAPRLLIAKALRNVTPARELAAIKLLTKKRHKKAADRVKFIRFLASRGFSHQAIGTIFDYESLD